MQTVINEDGSFIQDVVVFAVQQEIDCPALHCNVSFVVL